METGIIIQARYNSTRFEGKIFSQINGKSILDIIIKRLQRRKINPSAF